MANIKNKWEVMKAKSPEAYAAHFHPDAVMDRKRAKVRHHQHKKLAWLREVKAGMGCVDCGEKDHRCLDFAHVDPKSKRGNLAMMARSLGWSALKAEIEKCVVRCSNCHRKQTFDDWKIGEGYPQLDKAGVEY